ncbi:MAG TPA: type II toxin-antitoxin system HipA family toxin [Longimicrobiaceae bacterium]|nr:type II toxin-antitoxin system HipA family toxin [Longimicrobiaceae bacterium]
MRRLEVRLHWGDGETVVGLLAEHDRRVYFEYDPAFLAAPLPISPFKLPPRPGLVEHQDREFSSSFGVFSDSLPDGWGLLLMDREFRKRGLKIPEITVLDRLGYIHTRGMGALTYHPSAGSDGDESFALDLTDLARQAERILEGSMEQVLPALRVVGGSPGGARPKVLVAVGEDGHLISGTSEVPPGYRHYLVKFAAREDPADIGPAEAAYALMAADAGITVPPSRLFDTSEGHRHFGAERFDRSANGRVHMHTLGGLLHASHRLPSVQYEGFLRATRELTKDHREVEEAFRRMAFNVIAHNRDDHVKNFSYLMDRTGTWRLAPAYDLVFSHGPGGEHTMAVAGEARRPTERDMLRVAHLCDVEHRRAREMVQQVEAAVGDWHRFAQATGVSATTEQEIGAIITVPLDRR